MPMSSAMKDRWIAGAAYALIMLVPVPILSIAIAWLLYHVLRDHSLFVAKHIKQNFNLITTLHVYISVLFFFYLILPSMESGLSWVTEKFPLLGLTMVLGGISSFFFIIISLILITAIYVVLVIFSLFGQWVRVPLIIRFFK